MQTWSHIYDAIRCEPSDVSGYLIRTSGCLIWHDLTSLIFVKIFKILLLRNRKEDEAETWHTCIGHCPLQKLFFYSGRIRTLVAMATYSVHRLSTVSLGITEFFFTEMFIE